MTFQGFEECPDWLKEKYREAVKFTCQSCNKHESEVGKLQPHRLKRGERGGLYTAVPLSHMDNNIKVLCKQCHRKLHENEWSHVQGK